MHIYVFLQLIPNQCIFITLQLYICQTLIILTHPKIKIINPFYPPMKKRQDQTSSSFRTYFYTNSVYMGTTKSMQRIGTGILLFHDNTCAIVSYNNNSELHGYSVFYRNRALVSVHWIRNRIHDVVYRVDGYLLYLRYDQQARIDGDGFIVDFIQRTVYNLKYFQGNFKAKSKLVTVDKLSIQNFLLTQAYHLLIGKNHAKIIKHELTSQQIPHIRMLKLGNKVQINYMQNPGQRLAQGLGFQLIYRVPQKGGYNPQTNQYKDQFQLKLIQKGQYKNNMIQGYGMRIFKNNNVYEGYFSNNVFHGEGCLLNVQKNSWVYGVFENGEMKDIVDFSNDGNQMAKCRVLLDQLRRNSPYFVNSMVEENGFDFLDVELERICGVNQISEPIHETFQDKKLQLMRRITAQFTQLELVNKQTLGDEVKKLKDSKVFINATIKKPTNKQGSETQRNEKKPYTIKSLIPQSARIPMPTQHQDKKRGQDQEQNIQRDREKFQRILEMSRAPKQPGKNYSRIFNKTYSHLEDQGKLEKGESVSPHKRLRKSQIFTSQAFQKTQSIWNKSKSGFGKQASADDGVYKGRSPQRQTYIFQSSVKLKKLKKNLLTGQNAQYQQQPIKSRKSSLDKKMFASKSKGKKPGSILIFDDQKEREIQNGNKFIYTYENYQQKPQKDNVELTAEKSNKKLKPPSLLMKSTRI